jgi:hypothetical protein
MNHLRLVSHLALGCVVWAVLFGPKSALAQQAGSPLLNPIDVVPEGNTTGVKADFQALLSGTNNPAIPPLGYSKPGDIDYDNTPVQSLTLDWDWNRAETSIAYIFSAPAIQASTRTVYAIPQYWTNSIETAHALKLAKDNGVSASLSTDWEIKRPERYVKGTRGIQAQSFNMEWRVTHLVPLDRRMAMFLEFGAAGYDGWVRTNTATLSGGLSPTGVPLSVHAAGFLAGFIVPEKNLSLTLKYEPEYKANNLSRGRMVVMGFSWTW